MAYNIVHSTNKSRLAPTDLYVRFKPTDQDQLETLAETLDLDLFDTPMDYSIVQEGNYYQDPSIPMEQITWQYAVVKPGFQFPAGITHEILDSIYIPSNSDYEVEDMAFQLLGDPDIDDPPTQSMVMGSASPYSTPFSGIVRPQVLQCPPGYHWDFEHMSGCVPDNCGPGMHWDPIKRECVEDSPIPPPLPTGPGSHYPAGYLKVYDTNFNTDKPLRRVRVVTKRWFKIQRLYTDDDGYFESSKRFRKKVKVIVKFKNDYAKIKGVRGLRLWQIFYAVRKKLGTYKGTLNNISYTFEPNAEVNSIGNRYWVAGSVSNDVQAYRDLADAQGIGYPPKHLKILISNWGAFQGGMAPMFAKRAADDLPSALLKTFVVAMGSHILAGVNLLFGTLERRVDIYYSYHVSDMDYLQSDVIAESIFHEMTHSTHFVKVGNTWWSYLVGAELSKIIANLGSEYSPYGKGTDPLSSPIIALAESWAYYMGHYLADQVYGSHSSDGIVEQDIPYYNNFPVNGLSSHLNLLEDFSPNRTNDPFHWIPQGLFYDLMDDRNENSPITDAVSGYTNQEFFNALDSDIDYLEAYRQRLLQENGNDQVTQVNQLFNEYGY